MVIRAHPSSAGYMFAGWPASPPVFEAVAAPPRLWIPIPPGASGDVSPRIAGETVTAGSRVVAEVEGAPAALAPSDGKCIGFSTVTIAGADERPLPAVEFEPAGDVDPVWAPFDDIAALRAMTKVEPSELVDRIERLHSAGVWAQRITCPNLGAQLNAALRRPIDTIICTILDSDPTACLSAALAGWYGLELAAGMALLSRVTRGRGVCAIDARLPATWSASLRQACALADVRVMPMVNDYPQSDPTLMIYSLLGRRLRPGRSPVEQGVLYLDAPAAIAIGRCALDTDAGAGAGARAMTSLPLAVRDHVLRQSFFVFAPLGMRVSSLLDQLRIAPSSRALLRAGDAARDLRIDESSIIAAGELLLHASATEPAVAPDPCVRCGWCIDACPTRVHPAGVLEAAQRPDVALAESYGLDACIECGICSYVCPSRLPLLPAIRAVRARRSVAVE
jgi:electron transport complex protein RnfC